MTRPDRGCLLGVDIGGTFTDLVLADNSGALTIGKVLTTPADPSQAVVTGVRDILARTGTEPGRVTRVAHATTLATNVILERKGVPVAFVTTKGFRSLLTLGRSARVEEQRYNLFFDVDDAPVPPSHCFEVPERIGAGGTVLQPLDERAAREVAARIAALGVQGVAVCFLHSFANPTHERRMAELLREALPHTTVVASAEIWPELREYERATTALMSAYVGPVMEGYLAALTERLAGLGIHAPVHIMDSSGSVMSAALAAQRAVYTIESGPAAGVMAVQHLGSELGLGDLISFDMGGTTAKAGVVRGGRVDVTRQFHVGGSGSFGGRREGTGIPIKAPAIDLAEVGAGGGSVAWVDAGGTLRVGPVSAGSDPGPACYGRGGERPTVTDANLVLGYLDPSTFAAGTVPLYPDRSVVALRTDVCDPLGVDVAAAAHAVHEIANANMAAAVHVVTVQRGIDPRRFAMVALGGAGPMHAAAVAERFDIRTVIVPPGSGVGSAIGLLTTDLAVEAAHTFLAHENDVDLPALARLFDDLVAQAVADLAMDPRAVTVERSADLRYAGQAHEITVVADDGPVDEEWWKQLGERFHRQYAQSFGDRARGATEIVNARVRVTAPAEKLAPPAAPAVRSGRAPTPRTVRNASFAAAGTYAPTPIFDRAALHIGDTIDGPAIVEAPESTAVVPPAWRATLDEHGNLVLTRSVV